MLRDLKWKAEIQHRIKGYTPCIIMIPNPQQERRASNLVERAPSRWVSQRFGLYFLWTDIGKHAPSNTR